MLGWELEELDSLVKNEYNWSSQKLPNLTPFSKTTSRPENLAKIPLSRKVSYFAATSRPSSGLKKLKGSSDKEWFLNLKIESGVETVVHLSKNSKIVADVLRAYLDSNPNIMNADSINSVRLFDRQKKSLGLLDRLDELGIKCGDTIYLQSKEDAQEFQTNHRVNSNSELPKLTRNEYFSIPTIAEISKMSQED